MSGFLANPMYNVCTENEISVILSHFDMDYIFNVIEDNIDNRFQFLQINAPNIVASFEQNFKQLLLQYTSDEDIDKINHTRTETYITIINILCKKFQLQFNMTNVQDYYSIAFYLYDLLVSGFSNNLTTFFTNFIIKEKNGIYDSLNLNDFKKSKDTSTIYNKKLYKNTKLAIINSNLDYVINNICCYDITFETILNNIYQDKNMVKFILMAVSPLQDFFRNQYVTILQGNLRPIILTNIRLDIQNQSINENINIQNIL